MIPGRNLDPHKGKKSASTLKKKKIIYILYLYTQTRKYTI